jgi:hypothetical protein
MAKRWSLIRDNHLCTYCLRHKKDTVCYKALWNRWLRRNTPSLVTLSQFSKRARWVKSDYYEAQEAGAADGAPAKGAK